MKKGQIIVLALLLVLLLAACAPAAPVPGAAPAVPAPVTAPAARAPVTAPAAPAKASWEMEWDRTVEAAQREGTMAGVIQFGTVLTQALNKELKSKFGVTSQWLAGSSSELAVRVKSERRAGIYSVDVGIIGHITPYEMLKPAGIIESLDKVLFLPELTDPQEIKKVWRFGELLWVEKEHTILVFTPSVAVPLTINTELVKPGEVKSYRDLLNPKWKGKIVIQDPTVGSGGGFSLVQAVGVEIMGWDYFRKLMQQDPILIRDRRIGAEWIARGKMAIGFGLAGESVKEFKSMGTPITKFMPEEGSYLGAAGGAITLFKDAPHPNAAKLFINWLLTKEGQTLYRDAMALVSARSDVSTEGLDPMEVPDPKMDYSKLKGWGEKFILERGDVLKTAKEIFVVAAK